MPAPLAPSGLVDASGRPISRFEVQRVRASALVEGFGSPAFEGARREGTYFSEWPARLASADKDWLPSRATATARVRERTRNDPVAAAVRSRKVNSAVGKGWRLKARPNARMLGIDFDAARELGAALSTEFHSFAYSYNFQSDAQRRLTLGQQLRLAGSHLVVDGEFLGLTEWAENEGTRYKTRLRMVDPDRLCNPNGRSDSDYIRAGVEYNNVGIPFRYHIRERHPSDFGFKGSFHWQTFDRWTDWGRPQVLHGFEVERDGQTRGISRFVAALKSFRALSRFTDAMLEAATINALIVAFMKSNSGPQAAGENFEVKDIQNFEKFRQDYYEETPVSLANGSVIPVLPYGDEVQLQTASKDVTSFDAFTRSIIRLIASALGVAYEELSMDYSQTNYSSARAAMLHAWSETLAMMGLLEDQLMRPFYVAWLEECFDSGFVKLPAGAPDFWDAVEAYAQFHCLGPGRGYIDPTKEIDAAAARIEAGMSSLEKECDDQGEDWEEILEQQARERAKRKELGLPEPAGAMATVAATSRQPEHAKALDERPAIAA